MPSKPDFHAAVKAAEQMAQCAIRHHSRSSPLQVNHQGGGLSNFVFSVEQGGEAWIIRLNSRKEQIHAYRKEQYVTAKARRAGVPAPEVLEVGGTGARYPYQVARKSAGTSAVHHSEKIEILRELGRYAALIHSIRTKGFGGRFEGSAGGNHSTWLDYLYKELNLEHRLRTLRRLRILNAQSIQRLEAVLTTAGSGRTPRLNHGDLRLKNVLVDGNGKIHSIIDWEHAASNLAPEWDLALALHDLSIDEAQTFLDGYGLRESALREAAPLIKALNLLNYAPVVEEIDKQNDARLLAHYRTRLSGALDLYSL